MVIKVSLDLSFENLSFTILGIIQSPSCIIIFKKNRIRKKEGNKIQKTLIMGISILAPN